MVNLKSINSPHIFHFLSNRPVQIFTAATILSILGIALLGPDLLPFDRPAVGNADRWQDIIGQIIQMAFALLVIAVAYWVTRKRPSVNFDARTPSKAVAKQEAFWLFIYGTVVLFAGAYFGIGMHLHGAVFGPTREMLPKEVYIWASYNFVFFAVIPYVFFRWKGSNHHDMCLTSENLRGDTLLIFVILIIESIGELATFPGLFSLSASQLAIGIPLTLVLHLLGTGIPVMIFVYALLFPRYVKASGSATSAVIYGALTYAWLHLFEYWTVFDTLANGTLSIIFIVLQFSFPGLIKSYLTMRTGNAWVHLWAYHAIAPHVTVDTPHMVHVFGIK